MRYKNLFIRVSSEKELSTIINILINEGFIYKPSNLFEIIRLRFRSLSVISYYIITEKDNRIAGCSKVCG